eukprot:4601595-Pleurochrysis_carterae.AAC.3
MGRPAPRTTANVRPGAHAREKRVLKEETLQKSDRKIHEQACHDAETRGCRQKRTLGRTCPATKKQAR